ncbi:MAG: hypothetical protein A2918_03555 [Candidatus Yanofskybacteria bacterium RIFCSPLOWO2_01_FULL_42_49]|uniref:Four helix bundle protein n=1 Tax=Candidatus Yanofskybacteria bacterium RIFCSPLOWO2_01_FULL_42_49 TaxID=1802694 RepID=A0A1F8GEC0_9BACT|nr:MAG: hypothetical protein A2918_03555 [Candidatus Yanofskybacteria bacterium RIFCSPLOWO2_01_FULL_42_49]
MYTNFKKYTPKKPVHKFTDLDVYQQTLALSVIIVKDLRPKLVTLKYAFVENSVISSTSLPMWIAEAHSVRFNDHAVGLGLLEKVMSGCNKMVVYLEQVKGIHGTKLDNDLIDDLVKRYHDVRLKVFRLSKSWQKWYEPKK